MLGLDESQVLDLAAMRSMRGEKALKTDKHEDLARRMSSLSENSLMEELELRLALIDSLEHCFLVSLLTPRQRSLIYINSYPILPDLGCMLAGSIDAFPPP